MTQAWLTFVIGLLFAIWGCAKVLKPKVLRWARKENVAKFRAITDVVIGAFLIYAAIVFL